MVLNYQQKRNIDFIHKSGQYVCFKLCYGHYKKNQPAMLHIQVERAIPVNQHVRQKFYNYNENMAEPSFQRELIIPGTVQVNF